MSYRTYAPSNHLEDNGVDRRSAAELLSHAATATVLDGRARREQRGRCRCSTLPPALALSAQAAVTHGSFTAGVAAVQSGVCLC